MTRGTADRRRIGPEVFEDVEVLLRSGKRLQFSRLYLFRKPSFLLLYRFGDPWPHLLPWPAPKRHTRIVGYLNAAPGAVPATLRIDIDRVTARSAQATEEISDVAVLRISSDSEGGLQVKFTASRCELKILRQGAVARSASEASSATAETSTPGLDPDTTSGRHDPREVMELD